MKFYSPGQRAVYEEDGARAVVEVVERTLKDGNEKYTLRVVSPVNASKPTFVGSKRVLDDPNDDPKVNFTRGFKTGQELKVSRNLNASGGSCWGMWTLTDLVEESSEPVLN